MKLGILRMFGSVASATERNNFERFRVVRMMPLKVLGRTANLTLRAKWNRILCLLSSQKFLSLSKTHFSPTLQTFVTVFIIRSQRIFTLLRKPSILIFLVPFPPLIAYFSLMTLLIFCPNLFMFCIILSMVCASCFRVFARTHKPSYLDDSIFKSFSTLKPVEVEMVEA